MPLSFGKDLPAMRDWVPKHFDFAGYIIGEHPQTFGSRAELRRSLGYRPDERVCIVTVGGSGVGAHLIRRILQSYPIVSAKLPELRMIVVAGPRIDPASLDAPAGVEVRAFVPDLDRHLAACDLALVQGGLTTCMELDRGRNAVPLFPAQEPLRAELPRRASSRPLRRRAAHGVRDVDAGHDCGRHGRRAAGADRFRPVEADGAARAARMLAELFELTGFRHDRGRARMHRLRRKRGRPDGRARARDRAAPAPRGGRSSPRGTDNFAA